MLPSRGGVSFRCVADTSLLTEPVVQSQTPLFLPLLCASPVHEDPAIIGNVDGAMFSELVSYKPNVHYPLIWYLLSHFLSMSIC